MARSISRRTCTTLRRAVFRLLVAGSSLAAAAYLVRQLGAVLPVAALLGVALSAGWRASFQALLDRERSGGAVTGNPGLTPAAGPPPAWTGFRPLRVSRKDRESASVTSLVLEGLRKAGWEG